MLPFSEAMFLRPLKSTWNPRGQHCPTGPPPRWKRFLNLPCSTRSLSWPGTTHEGLRSLECHSCVILDETGVMHLSQYPRDEMPHCTPATHTADSTSTASKIHRVPLNTVHWRQEHFQAFQQASRCFDKNIS